MATSAFTSIENGLPAEPVKLDTLERAFKSFHNAAPFDHCLADGFLANSILEGIEKEFLPYDSPKWFVYKNAIEDKKALNDWNAFPATTYQFFSYLNSAKFVMMLSKLVRTDLYPDGGLHGGAET
jgi:hypothetical protein